MSLIGDSDGEISQEIVNDFGTAYSDLISMLLKIAAPEIVREVYYTLPANTNVLFPSQLGVSDFSEPQQLYERGNVSSTAISSVDDGTPISITVAGLPQPTNGRVELNNIPNVPPWLNRDWFITITGANTFTLNGSVATGVGGQLATTGSVMWSPETFESMGIVDITPPNIAPGSQVLGSWRWVEGTIYFPNVSNEPRQLWIEYLADTTPPVSGTIGLLNGRELKFLSHATAAHFAPKRQLPMGPQLAAWAYGPSGEADGSGGFLRQLIVPVLKQKNQLPRRSGLFRLRRGVVVLT